MDYVIKSAKTQEEAIEKGLLELGIKREDADIQILEEEKSGLFGMFGQKDAIVKIKKKEDVESFVKNILYKDEKKQESSEPKIEKKAKNKPIKKEAQEKPTEKKAQVIENYVDDEKKEEIKEEINTEEVQKEEDSKNLKVENKSLKLDIWDNIELKNNVEEFMSTILDSFNIDYYLDIELEENELLVDVKSNNEEDLGIVIGKYGSTLDALQYLLGIFINKHREEYIRVKLDSNGYRDRRNQTLRRIAKKGVSRLYKYKKPVRLEPMNSQERRAVHLMLQENEDVTTYSEGREPYRRVVITFKK